MSRHTPPTIPELAPGVRVTWEARDGAKHTGTIIEINDIIAHIHIDGTPKHDYRAVSLRESRLRAIPLRKDGHPESNRLTPLPVRIARSVKAMAAVRAKTRICIDCSAPFKPTGMRSQRCEDCAIKNLGRQVMERNRRMQERRRRVRRLLTE